MSKEIDTSKPKDLTFLERLYLQDRGELPSGAEPVTGEDVAEYNERRAAGSEASVDEFDADTTPYPDWPKKELLREIEARNEGRSDDERMSKSGTVAELAERLAEDDEA